MPIANCFINPNTKISGSEFIVDELSENLGISAKDITINFIKSDLQVGKQYELMIFLFLPSLWSKEDKERIGLVFTRTLSKKLGIAVKNIFSITSIIDSGDVISDNKIERW